MTVVIDVRRDDRQTTTPRRGGRTFCARGAFRALVRLSGCPAPRVGSGSGFRPRGECGLGFPAHRPGQCPCRNHLAWPQGTAAKIASALVSFFPRCDSRSAKTRAQESKESATFTPTLGLFSRHNRVPR